jgi:transposase
MGKNKQSSKKTRRYSDEFKADAVKIVTTANRPVAQIARELGIDPGSLASWVRQLSSGVDNAVHMGETDTEELKRLRKENKTLRMERDLLKKATTFFAKENETW